MKLSVITPTHNRMLLLEQLLQSLEQQTYLDFEVVIAVDGSSDGTLTMLEAYKRRQTLQLEVVILNGVGRAAARNAAIARAKEAILVFADDDLTLEPEVLARHVAFHQLFKDGIAVGAVRFPDGVVRFSTRPDWMNFSGCNCSVAREAIVQLGGFNESLTQYGGEDLELGYRLLQAGQQFKALAQAEVFHHGARVPGVEKAHAAGYNAVYIAQKLGGSVALQLGVHPSLLLAKRTILNPLGDAILGTRADYAFERAYLDGARAAWKELKNDQT